MGAFINPVSAATQGGTPTSTAPTPQPPTDPLASKDVFLQLKNQDPLSPADGLQFVTQLAQFTSLEQSTQMRDDLDAILTQLKANATPTPAPTGTGTNPDVMNPISNS
jgi:flagellar basal-body rod modification protein FlgD